MSYESSKDVWAFSPSAGGGGRLRGRGAGDGLDALPLPRQAEVLDFVRFLHQQTALTEPPKVSRYSPIELRVVPATTLLDLTGLVALGGDSVVDTEALYDNASHH